MELIVVRHGLPVAERRRDGARADPGLSELGFRQARCVAKWLAGEAIDALYSSPLQRARDTATPLSEAVELPVAVDEGLSEYDADADIYIPAEQWRESDPEEFEAAVERLRSLDAGDFQRTVVAAMNRLIEANPGRCVAVFCHGGVINAWASHVIGSPRVLFFGPAYASINRFMVARTGERSLLSLNDRSHLRVDGLL